jgi:hypothetical protein
MNDLALFGFWVFLSVVVSVTLVVVFWTRIRKYQMRNDLILKVLESGQSLDPETLDRLLAASQPPGMTQMPPPPRGPVDPRSMYRSAAFIDFLIGFGTIFFAFFREGTLSYPLVALGLLPIVLAFYIWRGGENAFRDGTLPTLKYKRDPREPYLNAGGVAFFVGYATIFIGIIREAGMSYPIIGLGLAAVVVAVAIWAQGDREYREGRLTGPTLEGERE